MKQRRLATVSAAVALLIATTMPTAVHAANQVDPERLPVAAINARHSDAPTAPLVGAPELDKLTLPVIPDALLQAGNELSGRLGDHPNLASVGVTTDRTHLEVYWYGNRTPELNRAVAEAESAGARVVIQPSAYFPEELRTKAQQLVAGAAGVAVASAGVYADGSGLDVALQPVDDALATSADQMRVASAEVSVQAFAGVPVTFTDDVPVSAADPSRQLDLYHMGGARIWRYENPYVKGGCTSGFAVSNASGAKGLVSAAHCGAVGSQWIIWDKELGGANAFTLGSIVERSTAYDGSIIDTGTSYPYMWTSGWNSTIYTGINGLVTPLIGQELCYSGSYSGLICGNIVQQKYVYYFLDTDEGDLTNIKGILAVNSAGTPAAGNGDSGGPGYVLSSTPTGYKRYAATIISAIPGDSGSTCSGIPGSDAEGGRKCSATVYQTEVVDILADTGWTLPGVS